MFEAKIKIPCKNPSLIKKSLEPDIKNDKYSQTKISAGKNFLEISVKSKKLSHLRAIVNTYMALVQMLIEADEKIK